MNAITETLKNSQRKNVIMKEVHHITNSEKKLLNIIGKNPEISVKELLNYTEYKWVSTVTRKLKRLKEQNILFGPFYFIDFGKLSRNPLHKPYCVLELNESYETVISYLKLIEPLTWVFPVLSHKRILNAIFLSSDNEEMRNLFELLKDCNILSDYTIYVRCHDNIIENPNLFGDPNPLLTGLLNPCDCPDMSPGQYETEWNECDIQILPYFQRGVQLIEILRAEKKMNNSWTYKQVRYSREKMVNNRLIKKNYVVSPFQCSQCADFQLFLQSDDITMTRRILCNFARGERVYKEYALCDEGGIMFCASHPRFVADLMDKLDQVDHIRKKEIYQLRSTSRKYNFGQLPQLKYYDFDKQTLEYPYHLYREKIKEKLENER